MKRETTEGLVYENWKEISIHSLVKRETIRALPVSVAAVYFNPLPREEGDL